LIEERRNIDPEIVDRHPLGSVFEIQTLHGIQSLEGRESDGESEAKKVDHGNRLSMLWSATSKRRIQG
jgi:hypothetical protein